MVHDIECVLCHTTQEFPFGEIPPDWSNVQEHHDYGAAYWGICPTCAKTKAIQQGQPPA